MDVRTDGLSALSTLSRDHYDMVILDRMLPGASDGVDTLRRLRGEGVETPVIILTALGRMLERVEGLDEGADDYIVKPFEIEELHARMRAVFRRRAPASSNSATISVGDITVSLLRHRVSRAGKQIELGRTELKLLAELARSAGNVLTRQMLLERVWGYDFRPTTNLVDSYIMRLRQRLHCSGLPDPIITVRGVGYMIDE